MLQGYANARDVAKSYIGLMAGIFAKYPRSVVRAAVDPDGIPLTTKFVPTPSDVLGWLERKTRPMHEESEREDRIDAQLRARDEWLSTTTNKQEVEHRKQLADEWLKRLDPRAVELSGEHAKGEPSPEEVERLMSSAKSAASMINSGTIKLSDEAAEIARARDVSQAMDG